MSKVTWQGQLLDALLEQRFSISTGFHPGQHDIIEHLIQGKRVLAIQRTGWGKSLCYLMASLLSDYDAVRTQKLHELEAMQNYAHHAGCSMGYLTEYLGDPTGYCCGVCGHCQQSHFPPVTLSERIRETVTHFLEYAS